MRWVNLPIWIMWRDLGRIFVTSVALRRFEYDKLTAPITPQEYAHYLSAFNQIESTSQISVRMRCWLSVLGFRFWAVSSGA